MRIWYIHPSAGGPGVGRYWRAYYFAKHWAKSGHQCMVISASYHHLLEPDSPRRVDEHKDGVHYAFVPTVRYSGNGIGRKLSMLLFSLLLAPYCLFRALKQGRPDAIIYSSPHPFGYVSAWLAAKLLRAKILFEVRDIWPLSLVELADMSPDSRVVKVTGWIEQFAYRKSDKVVSLLPCAKDHMVGKGLAPEKFVWIPNGVGGVELDSDEAITIAPLEQHVIDLRRQGNFVVIYAGALGEPNAIHTVLEAFRLLKASHPAIRLLLVGRGVMKSRLMQYAEREALTNVEFHDQIDKADVMKVLKQASAGYISLNPQPIFRFGISPNKLWDYMMAKLPVIFACKAGNNPVEDHQCGLSADPMDPESIADAIKAMSLHSDADRQRMGEAGYEAVLRLYEYKALAARFEDEIKN